ncbi:DUF1491 family protein [Qipengyuania soli]|uniref:DUF1491 family protein n=1 Tax=Qipengyuania soli TaxID=2782568 RepID=A0A7S8F427_9SPHN|nr:DUF1491 family protein [Qipengyuania soli]QPC98710.1 DUF1491 family protein [Qipengyuania soli]
MSDARLPAHLEVSALLRLVESNGGFAAVLQRGERDAGTIMILTTERGNNTILWERMPQLDNSRPYTRSRTQGVENKKDFDEYIQRRMRQDPDAWVIELDIVNAERFISTMVT